MPGRKRTDLPELSDEATEAEIDAMVAGMIESEAMEACARYLTRGRQLAQLEDGELQARWAEAFRGMIAERTSERMRELDDAESELRLRDLKPDESLVRDAASAFAAEIRRMQAEHPDGIPAILDGVRDYLRRKNEQTN
jgi:hypothetical protein